MCRGFIFSQNDAVVLQSLHTYEYIQRLGGIVLGNENCRPERWDSLVSGGKISRRCGRITASPER